MMLAEESSSSSKVEDEVSAIGVKPISLVELAIQQPTTQATRLAQRGIIIGEPVPQEQPTQEVLPEGTRKKKLKKIPAAPFRDTTPFPPRRAQREAEENKLREEAQVQKQRNLGARVGALELRSSSISQELE